MLGPELIKTALESEADSRYKRAAAGGIETPQQRFERDIITTLLSQRGDSPQFDKFEIDEGPDGKKTAGVKHVYMRDRSNGSMLHVGTVSDKSEGGGKVESLSSADSATIDSFLFREFEQAIREGIAKIPNADVNAELASLQDPTTGRINYDKAFRYLTPKQRRAWTQAASDYAHELQTKGQAQDLFSKRIQAQFPEQADEDSQSLSDLMIAQVQPTGDNVAAIKAIYAWNREHPDQQIPINRDTIAETLAELQKGQK